MDEKLATKRVTAQVPALPICCCPERGAFYNCSEKESGGDAVECVYEVLFPSMLDQLDLVAFRSVDECNSAAVG